MIKSHKYDILYKYSDECQECGEVALLQKVDNKLICKDCIARLKKYD